MKLIGALLQLTVAAVGLAHTWLSACVVRRAWWWIRRRWARCIGWARRPRSRRAHIRLTLKQLRGKGLKPEYEQFKGDDGLRRHRLTVTDQDGETYIATCGDAELPEAANAFAYHGGFG